MLPSYSPNFSMYLGAMQGNVAYKLLPYVTLANTVPALLSHYILSAGIEQSNLETSGILTKA